MRRLSPTFGAALASLAILLAGCGGADSEAVDDLASEFASTGSTVTSVSEEQAKCRARIFLESGLSEKALDALRKTGQPTADTEDDREKLAEAADKILEECM